MEARDLSVSMEEVREHLAQLGYHDVPDQVLEDFTSELTARIESSAVADELLVAHGAQRAAEAESGDEEPRGGGAGAAGAVGGGGGGRAPARGGEGPRQALRPRSAAEDNRRAGAAVSVRQQLKESKRRGTRLGGGAHSPGDGAESGAEHDEGVAPAAAGERGEAQHADVRSVAGGTVAGGSVAGGRGVRRDGSSASVRSTASQSSSFIRPQTRERRPRTDPVGRYWQLKQSWADAPAVTGARKQVIAPVASTRKPTDKPIWKAVHPMDNSLGTSKYQVPTDKKRVELMASVRDVMKWQEVYKPAKADRVHANEMARSYTIPDEKRRDDVRWSTRCMMNQFDG